RKVFFQGMLWIMIVYLFMMFLGTREKAYLMYMLFLLASSVYFLYLSELSTEWFFSEHPRLNIYVWIISSNVFPFAYLQFARSYLKTERLFPGWDRWMKSLLWGVLGLTVIQLLIAWIDFRSGILALMADFAFLLEAGFLATLCVFLIRTRHRLGRTFVFGSFFMVFAAVLGVISDLLSAVEVNLWMIETAFVIQILTFSFGLADHINQERQKALEAQKELNQKLVEADRLKDQFLANTSHELRTPLNGIIGLSEAMLDEMAGKPQHNYLSMIISSGKRLASLVNDLLDFSKLKTDTLILRPQAVDVRTLVDVIVTLNRHLIGDKPLVLDNRLSPELPAVWADEARLEQILFNLINNAIKFTPKGEVWIDGKVEDEKLVIGVHDTGIGIPEDQWPHIFDSFQQVAGDESRAFGGSGLGLSISKRLVELQSGKIWLTSSPGLGSHFFFSLPISLDKAESRPPVKLSPLREVPATPSLQHPSADISTTSYRLLLVDDDVVNQAVLKAQLSPLGFQLVSAMSGPEALAKIETGPRFDLILLDIMMPNMSGFDVCEQVRKKFLPSELPIIMLTAKNQVTDLVQALEQGANDYIAKPFNQSELHSRIRTQLNLNQLNRAASRFVPTEFIASLGSQSILDVKLGDHKHQEISVFFSDIRSYTGLSEGMSPDDNFQFINAYAGRMGPIIRQHQGFVHQYLGDGIMALFQQSPIDAIQAAIDMQTEIRTYNAVRLTKNRRALRVGMGIHFGPLIMGIIGDADRTDPGTVSDTVNTAARMEGLTKYYGCNIILSEESLNRISGHPFRLRFLGKVQVKGKKQPLGIYECLDGEEPEQRKLKQQSLSQFSEGLSAYLHQDFGNAVLQFRAVIEGNPADQAARRYLSQAARLVVDGVPPEWDGVVSMTEK
ncbi:MAG: ATP-binding protein, partial [Bacteroidota bacterium]